MGEWTLSNFVQFLRRGFYCGVSRWFGWTGFENMKDRLQLLDAIHLAFNHPEYAPKDGVTHCNSYVNEVCETYGFKELSGKLANDICDFLSTHPQWSEISMDKCQSLANEGTLIVAGAKAEGHGHVVVVCPGKEKSSGRWGNVPSVASVGKENTIGKGLSWSFSEMPKFWAWRPTL